MANGAVTTYQYDPAGNRTAVQLPSFASSNFFWDAAERMVAAEVDTGTWTLVYNADGQRIAKEGPSTPRGFLYDHRKLLHETNVSVK